MIEIDTLGREIQLFRGKLSELPILLEGQPACAFDDLTNQPSLWIGTTDGNKRIQAEQYVIDDLVSNDPNASLSARQGKILKDMIDASGGGSGVSVVDNLLSSSPVSALSARQGKILNEKLISHENNINNQKHIEIVTQSPVDLTNTGVVLLHKDETPSSPDETSLSILGNKVDSILTNSKQMAIVTRTSDFTILNNTETNFLYENINKTNNADFVELNEFGQINFTKSGNYLVSIYASFVNDTGQRFISFDGQRLYSNAINIFPTTMSSTQIVTILNPNTIRDFVVYQNSGNSLKVTSNIKIVKISNM